MATLHLDIDGEWSAPEFAGVLMDLQELYAFSHVMSKILEKARSNESAAPFPSGALQTIPKMLTSKSLYSFVDPNELELRLLRVKYGSKGFTDLLGAGKIIETLKDFVLKIIELSVTHGERQQKVAAMRIENARSMVALTKELGYSTKQIQGMVRWVDTRQKDLFHLASQRKLLQVSVGEETGDQESKPEPDLGPFPTGRKFRI
jgi:hypothetical protein